MRNTQHTDGQTHIRYNSLTERGFGFTDDHERTPVSWFQYPDDEPGDDYAEDRIREMSVVARDGTLRRQRHNGAARSVMPVNDPAGAARFVQFLIDHRYAPAPTAALFLVAGIERRFTHTVAREIGVPLRSLCRYVTLAKRAMNDTTTINLPPVEDLTEPEPKHNPRNTDYWRKTRNGKAGGEIRDAVKATMRKMLEAQPGLSDATLARMLTERARVAISRRTVTKYRLAMGVCRQGTMKAAIAEALERDPELTDAELAAMLSKSTKTRVSPMSVARNRIKLGIRHRRPNRRRRKFHTDSTQTAGLSCGNLR